MKENISFWKEEMYLAVVTFRLSFKYVSFFIANDI